MNCDQKSLRDLLSSAFSLPAVESVLRAVQGGEEITVTMESGEILVIKDMNVASEFLVETGCAPRLVRQVERAINAGPYMQEVELKRLRKHWAKVRARHVDLMQEAFRVSRGLKAAQEKMDIRARNRPTIKKTVKAEGREASPNLKQRFGT